MVSVPPPHPSPPCSKISKFPHNPGLWHWFVLRGSPMTVHSGEWAVLASLSSSEILSYHSSLSSPHTYFITSKSALAMLLGSLNIPTSVPHYRPIFLGPLICSSWLTSEPWVSGITLRILQHQSQMPIPGASLLLLNLFFDISVQLQGISGSLCP